jgi:uncharacterized protein YndB with AHSA1/START domain
MTSTTPILVRLIRRFSVRPERVFDAFLDPALAGRFMFATPTGQMTKVEIDPRVGGSFAFVDRRDGRDVSHVGTYLEIDRPRRLVFSFAVGGVSSDPDRVAIEIVPLATGCELTLTHEMKPEWAEYVDRTEAGWGMILQGLETAIGRTGDPAGL